MNTTLHHDSREDPGWSRVRRGKGFEYRDLTGQTITDAVELSRIRALVLPPAWTDVWICPDPLGYLQATGVDAAGRTQYRYHEDWTKEEAEKKFEHMLELAAVLPHARATVTHDLAQSPTGRATVLAAGFRMLDTAHLRIGSERYAKEHGTIGLTTLRGSHVTIDGDDITLKFRGKEGVPWDKQIDDSQLAPVLDVLRERGARKRLLAWSEGPRWRVVHPDDINEDVRARTGGDFTAKAFRTIHGTTAAARSLALTGLSKTEKEQKHAMTEAVDAAAKTLGNTPAVAKSSYVDPRVFEAYEAGRIVDPHRAIEGQLATLFGVDNT